MNSEYLLFNLFIISGPLALSFDRRVHFVQFWRPVLGAILPTAGLFIAWDILVEGRHWFFNPQYTLNLRLLGLPPGEWLFFFTIPYAALFVWEVLHNYFPELFLQTNVKPHWIILLMIVLALPAIFSGKIYTALTLLALALAIALDEIMDTKVLQKRGTLLYFSLLTLMILIFNGYLTARPVVLYDTSFQLNWRIFSIPIEDFGYGFAHILMTTVIYEKLRRRPK